MPNDGEDPQEPQTEEGNHGEADSTPPADDPEFDAVTISFEEINFTQMLEASGPKISDPGLAKEWLLHFGPLHPDTNVAIALAGATKVSEERVRLQGKGFPSLLPFLIGCLDAWSNTAKKARSEQRRRPGRTNARTVKEAEDNLQWVRKYIVDYMGLHKAGFDPSDLADLTRSVLEICTATTVIGDLDQALQILQAILVNPGINEGDLEAVLSMLCNVIGSLRRSQQGRTMQCLQLIFDHTSEATITTMLYIFVKAASDKGIAKTVNTARGSVRVLRDLILRQSDHGAPFLDFDRLIKVILEAAEMRLANLDGELLDLLYSLLEGESRSAWTFSQDWKMFIMAINTMEISNIKARQSDTTTADGRIVEHNNQRIWRIRAIFEQDWERLSELQKHFVFEYLMMEPRTLTEGEAMRMLEYVSSSQLCWPTNADWQQSLNFVIDISCKSNYSQAHRINGVEILTELLRNADVWASPSSLEEIRRSSSFAISRAVRGLRDQIAHETDVAVMAALITALTDSTSFQSIDGLFTEEISESLTAVAIGGNPTSVTDQTNALLATNALVTIFMNALAAPSKRNIHAFECLVKIASLECPHSMARIAAMKLLFKVRCDSSGFIYVQNTSESGYVAAALCRTQESWQALDPAEPVPDQRRSVRTSSPFAVPRSSEPLWMYPDADQLPQVPPSHASRFVVARGHDNMDLDQIDMALWLEALVSCLQKDLEWETYSFVLAHFGAQLSNVELFKGSAVQISFLRRVLCEQVGNARFHDPPLHTGLQKSDVAICVFNILTPLIPYTTLGDHATRTDSDELVRAFLHGIGGQWEGTSRGCIHSLSICCLEFPASVARSYPPIIDKMTKNVTRPHLSLHILEFLAELARLPEEHFNLRDDEIRSIFGICIRVLEMARDKKLSQASNQPARVGTPGSRHSGVPTKKIPPHRAALLAGVDVPQYIFALAYHTMISWFLSLKLEIRATHVPWIIDRLVWSNSAGDEAIDDQSQAFIDMMQRTTFSDLGETLPNPNFAGEDDGQTNTASWIVGLSIITIETAGRSGRSQITKRQASGTTYSLFQHFTAELPRHHIPLSPHIRRKADEFGEQVAMLPSHILLQMVASAAPIGLSSQPIQLPAEDFVRRSLAAFDRYPTVDSYKMGVIYVGYKQTTESEILFNSRASQAFDEFLSGLGTEVSLENAQFITHGLVSGPDGSVTYAWRDRVSELIYHVPTLMPSNLDEDPNLVNKKRHIGNDFVNIIFNESGSEFDFNTFPSQFNYVNIVVTSADRVSVEAVNEEEKYPVARTPVDANQDPSAVDKSKQLLPKFFKVEVLTAPDFPSISPAADPKILSAQQVAAFVRLIGLNACVFAQAWMNRNSDTDYPSPWRSRLLEIRRLRERVVNHAAANAPAPVRGGPLYRDRGGDRDRKSLYPEDRSTLTSERRVVDYDAAGPSGDETLSEQWDFSKWTA